jgi:glycerate dehydrogenase
MTAVRTVVLDGFAADQGEPGAWAGLQALGALTVHPRTAPAELLERCQGATALVTNKVALDADVILGALPALRYVGVSATGTNVVDLAAARARGVAVTNVPGYAAESVAQLVMAVVLHLCLDVAGHDRAVKAGRWAAAPDFCFFVRPMQELAGKTLLILGRGAIGRAVARLGEALGMHVLAGAVPGSTTAGRVPLAEALPVADVVSLHCPLTTATTGLVDAAFLARLKSTALLVNTSRGALVREPDLLAALGAGRLGGVALDVLATEPPPADHPLTDPRAPWAGRVVVTPHMGWGTVEARGRLRAQVAANLRAFLAGERLNRVD